MRIELCNRPGAHAPTQLCTVFEALRACSIHRSRWDIFRMTVTAQQFSDAAHRKRRYFGTAGRWSDDHVRREAAEVRHGRNSVVLQLFPRDRRNCDRMSWALCSRFWAVTTISASPLDSRGAACGFVCAWTLVANAMLIARTAPGKHFKFCSARPLLIVFTFPSPLSHFCQLLF